jgi:NDP-sugar pyrophosphorylase family protein
VASDDLLVMNGDSYIDGGADLAAFYRFHKEHNAQVTLMLAKPRAEKDYGVVSLAADQKILRFNEKTDEPGEHFLSAGMYFMKKDAFATMPAGAFSLETEFFPKLVGGSFYGFPIEGSVVDIGTPERYRVAQEIFFN